MGAVVLGGPGDLEVLTHEGNVVQVEEVSSLDLCTSLGESELSPDPDLDDRISTAMSEANRERGWDEGRVGGC